MNKYWEFKAKQDNSADLYLYIEIADWGGGYSAHSAQSFKRELDALGEIDTLNVYINSPGGDVFEGNTIYNMLKRKKYTVNVYIDGLAASIASIIAMAGNKIIMPSNAMMMVHNPWTYSIGNASDLRKTADDLDKITLSLREVYIDRSNGKLDEETITSLLDNETWLTAQECYDYGLCDEIVASTQIAAKYESEALKNYKNVPKAFFNVQKQKTENLPVMDEATRLMIERINKL